MALTCEYLLGLPKKAAGHLRHRLGDTKLIVHLLVVVFATSSWADMNGLWVELPLLVLEAPEGWNLPSYITIISQVANIGPLVFVGLSMGLPHTKPHLETYTSLVIIIIGTLSAFLLAFFWQETSEIGGKEHSTALLILNFFLALGDCTSSVSFYAFMSRLKPQYMPSLFFGEGLSGMVPALIALGQGAGDIVCVNKSETTNKTFPNGTEYNVTTYNVFPEYVKPNFSVQVFFFTLTAILASSGVAFLLLNILPLCRSEVVEPSLFNYEEIIEENGVNFCGASDEIQEHQQNEQQQQQRYHNHNYGSVRTSTAVTRPTTTTKHSSQDEQENIDTSNNTSNINSNSQTSFNSMQSNNISTSTPISTIRVYLRLSSDISLFHFLAFISIIVVINLTLTSFLSTIGIYSTLPYGLQPYHLSSTLTAIANPAACLLALLFMAESLLAVTAITLLGLAGVVFVIYLAVMSPTPPLHGQDAGGVLIVCVWIVMTFLLIYAKVCVAGVMRQHGRTALICAGVATQAGSLIGATVGFIMTQDTHIFVQADFCG